MFDESGWQRKEKKNEDEEEKSSLEPMHRRYSMLGKIINRRKILLHFMANQCVFYKRKIDKIRFMQTHKFLLLHFYPLNNAVWHDIFKKKKKKMKQNE